MANYHATARSNYFAVRNENAFRRWADLTGLNILEPCHHDKVADGIPRFAITPGDHSDNGGWPESRYDEKDDHHDIDVPAELASHLADNEVAVLMEAGNERLRYVTGFAIAVNHKGETVRVDLGSIYEAARTLGGNITRAEY